MTIDVNKMEAALEFLAENDERFAQIKTLQLRTEILCKRARARIFLTADGNVEARKASAEVHGEVCAADDTYIEATREYEALKARMQRAEIVISVWQSMERSKR